MAGEFAIINPRRRRHHRRKRAKSSTGRRRRRRTHRGLFAANPRRRRRHVRRRVGARRHHARRRRHGNPRAMTFGGMNVGQMGLGAVGFIGAELGGGYLSNMLPKEWVANPLAKTGVKAAVGLGVPYLLKRFRIGSSALWNPIMLGAGIGIAVDLYHQYLAPALHLSDYSYVSDYHYLEPGEHDISGVPSTSLHGYGDQFYDSMY